LIRSHGLLSPAYNPRRYERPGNAKHWRSLFGSCCPADKRTSKDLFMFYGEIERTRPELLKRGHGDPYQQLKVDLRGYITF
jgi:hypothetical protein